MTGRAGALLAGLCVSGTIAWAQPAPCPEKPEGVRVGVMSAYAAELVGPSQQACNLAWNASRQYRDPTPEELAMVHADSLLIMVRTDPPRVSASGLIVWPAVTQVVVREGDRIVRPSLLTPVPQPWGNAAGAQVFTYGADAYLPWADLPPGPFEVLIVLQDGREIRHKIKADQRRKLR